MQKIREILRIGLPIMLGQACVIILAFADNIMIGWHSVDELAASSFVNNVMNLFILTELGFAAGMTPMIGADNGSVTASTLPLSLLFSTQTRPPWSRAISHTSGRPSPAPPSSRLSDLSTRKRG